MTHGCQSEPTDGRKVVRAVFFGVAAMVAVAT